MLSNELAPVHLSPGVYRALWLLTQLISFLSGTVCALFALIYWVAFTIRDGYYIQATGITIHVPTIIACYLGFGLYFGTTCVVCCTVSIYRRKLVYPGVAWSLLHEPLLQIFRGATPISVHPTRLDKRATSSRFLGMKFEQRYLLREAIEIAMQTYQVHKCSGLISQVWITNFFAVILIANCWVSPIIHLVTQRKRALQQFLFIWCDVLLDFVSVFVIPMCIAMTVLIIPLRDSMMVLDGEVEYAFDVPYDDIFTTNLYNAGKQFCALNWLDMFSKLLPFGSIAMCLNHIQPLLSKSNSVTAALRAPTKSLLSGSLGGLRALDSIRLPSKIHATRLKKSRYVKLASVGMTHGVFFCWGLVLLGIHIASIYVRESAATETRLGCKSSAQPWFVSRFSCTMLEVNCYRRNITGTDTEIEAAVRNIDSDGLIFVVFSHCAALQIPQSINAFHNLGGVEITNSTITTWDSSAALTRSTHPNMHFVQFMHVNMSHLPLGLQSPEFPRLIRDVSISNVNITDLPPDLHLKWTNPSNLYIEWTQLQHVPKTIAHMKIDRLSLLGNDIRTIPDDFFVTSRFSVLSVARNPIDRWPATIGKTDRLQMLLMDYTNITELPRWLLDEADRRASVLTSESSAIVVSAGGSALCRASSGTSTLVSLYTESHPGVVIICREKSNDELEGFVVSFDLTQRRP